MPGVQPCLNKVTTTMTTNDISYFETDQIKFALNLWKAAKKAQQVDFNVLKFTSQWDYADAMLQQLILSDDAATSELALDLLQKRIAFTQTFPERAKKIGATPLSSNSVANPHASAARKPAATPVPTKPDPVTPSPSEKRYIKGVR